jgi:twitching motility protein PilT
VALVTSLLTAIVRADGDALVLHAGERPYVVAPSGQSELSSRVLTLDAMTGMVRELLPEESRRTLDKVGAVQHDLPPSAVSEGEGFTVVAARGGDDVWIEIRRRRKSVVQPAPLEVALSAARAKLAAPVELAPVEVAARAEIHAEPEADVHEIHLDAGFTEEEPAYSLEPTAGQEPVPVFQPAPDPVRPPEPVRGPEPARLPEPVSPPGWAETPELARAKPQHVPVAESESHAATVRPLSRSTVRDQTVRFAQPLHSEGIDRLLRIAAARGASTLYLTSEARPSIRIDGEISAIEGEGLLSEPEVELLILDIMPERNREALRSEAGTEWICDVADVGRIRCVTFRDHRGAGGIFRMIPARSISAKQLGLSREIQGLCAEAEGLLLVTGPRSSGKSTLILAFVDLINRTRSDHVITLENEIKFVHESRLSLVSQREVRGDNAEWMAAARAALRENPDVLVIEDLRSPEVTMLALDAAQSGHLVIGALTAHTTAEAVDRIIVQTPLERRPKVQLGLAEALRGVVGQVLLRKSGGGRVAARELLLNTSAVANLIAEGKTSELPMAIDGGRKHGMVPLNDALASIVQGGIVDSREAYRQASDQQGFLALLKRQGVDTSFMERLA